MTELQLNKTGTAEVGHTHADVSGGWLRPAVFGAMDGLVTNISLVAGVGGGGASGHVIVLSGMAGLVAGALSMALGEYVSVETQNAAVRAEIANERKEIANNPKAEQAELASMYVEMGLSEETAQRVAAEVHEDPELALKVHITQELGVHADDQPSPRTAALLSLACFAIGALFPLIPFLFGLPSLFAGLVVGCVGLFAAGAAVARYTSRSWFANGLRQVLFGAAAAGATYLIGMLIGAAAA